MFQQLEAEQDVMQHLNEVLYRPVIPSLNGIRAFAAFLVVFYHYGWPSPGGLGVLTFFVLSGFLITWLLLREEDRYGRISLSAFYWRRSLRIFPAFYVYWILLVAYLLLSNHRFVVGQGIAAFFYVGNYYQAIIGDPNTGFSHTWSLGVEEQFYLLWPAAFLLLRPNRRFLFLLCAIPFIWVYRELSVWLLHRDQGYVYFAFDMRADHLLMGCLLAVAIHRRSLPGVLLRCSSRPWGAWIAVAGLAASSVMAAHITRYRDTIGFIVDPILVAILIVQVIRFPEAGLGRLLNLRAISYLGTISYSVYLYHVVLLGPVTRAFSSVPILTLPGFIGAVVLAATGSYFLIERPMLRLRNRVPGSSRNR